jgi:hypothetical protein
MHWFRKRPNYRIVIRGLESGNVTLLPWLTFTTEDEAKVWVERMNEKKSQWDPVPPLTRFDYEEFDE